MASPPDPLATLAAPESARAGGRVQPRHVIIAGGGFAGLEAVLALKALAGDRITVELIAPSAEFFYRPAATGEAANRHGPLRYDLAGLAAAAGGVFRRDRLEAVAPQARQARLATGRRPHYDDLILAMGAAPVAGVPGAITFRDQRDVAHVRALLGEIQAGAVDRVAFAVPGGVTWPLPLYELALTAASFAARCGTHVEITVVSPEGSPLQAFGETGSALVRGVLEEHGVSFVGGAAAVSFDRHGHLTLPYGESIRADRVIAVPELRPRRITGIPSSWTGFIPVDASGAVLGLDGVWAAGDITSYPIKQGGLATQQADRIAEHIAARAGVAVPPRPTEHILRARLIGGATPVELIAALDGEGRPLDTRLEAGEAPLDGRMDPAGGLLAGGTMPDIKVFGRHLTAFLADQRPLEQPLQTA